MTGPKKLSLGGGFALLAGLILMAALHQLAWRTFADRAMDRGFHMPDAMPWFMALCPLAMALMVGGIALLVISLLRRLGKAA
ncbi:MAG: hypothetical protein DI537_32100 [Stutzerimonas stutzeri]|jgi:uncharacterized membrane protein YidH (DUF202 family)|nr:MAG: hypothetical protein DI537_32100 [Stutzerimonas stutzeri]